MGIGKKILEFVSGGVVERAAELADKAIPDKDLAAKFKHELRSAQQSGELMTDQLQIEAERDIELAIQETHQVEAQQSDLYTKRTRPKIARQSWYLTMTYGAACIVTAAVPVGPEVPFRWEMFIAMAAPALAYMGIREFSKWRFGPKV